MRVSSPSSADGASTTACALAGAGTLSLLLLLVIVITGGFSFDAGPMHVSAHGWPAAVVATAALWAAAAASARGRLTAVLAQLHAQLVARATAIAVVLSASAAGVGIAYGTYTASASDASGYVSQARLLAGGSLTIDEPLARSVGWANATAAFAPLGYRSGTATGEIVPTYPPGLPLVMASALRVSGAAAIYLVVPLLGAVAVFATYRLGARLHSRDAGLVAATLMATSPVFLFQLVQPMSDVAAVAWWTLALLFALSTSAAAAAAAGLAAGLAVMTRPNLAPLALVVAVIAVALHRGVTSARAGRSRYRWPATYVAALSVPLTALLVWQARLYGSPLASGYGAFGELFALSAVWPNALGYTKRLIEGELPAMLLVVAAGALVLVTRGAWPDPASRPRARAAWIAVACGVTVAACYLPYAVFTEWSYLRFFLPALPLFFVLAGVFVSDAVRRLPASLRLMSFVGAATIAASCNIQVAAREQVFRLNAYEARYQVAGRYLDSSLPPDAVVIAVQQSGSARYYTQRPIVRWDQLPVDLDTAISDLISLGRRPVLLVERTEMPDLRARFPRSTYARLDWPPLATVEGASTPLAIFDPADRGRRQGSWRDVLR